MNERRYLKGFPISWDQLHRDAKALAWRLAELGPWERVITVTRGGMVPACIVARELEVRVIDTVCVASYDHTEQGEVRILKAPVGAREEGSAGSGAPTPGGGSGQAETPRDLVIDDLVDTGRTVAAVRALLPHAHYATVYAKPLGRPLVDTYVTEVSQDTWIHFPWDLELQFAQPIATTRPVPPEPRSREEE